MDRSIIFCNSGPATYPSFRPSSFARLHNTDINSMLSNKMNFLLFFIFLLAIKRWRKKFYSTDHQQQASEKSVANSEECDGVFVEYILHSFLWEKQIYRRIHIINRYMRNGSFRPYRQSKHTPQSKMMIYVSGHEVNNKTVKTWLSNDTHSAKGKLYNTHKHKHSVCTRRNI